MNRFSSNLIIKCVATLIVVVALVVWINSRWDTWFSNPPEPEYHTQQHPSRIVTTCTAHDNRIFSWVFGETPTSGEIEIILPDSHDTVTVKAVATLYESRSGKSVYYHAVVENLKPASEYRYRILHPKDTTLWKSFTTHTNKEKTQFIFAGDIQDNWSGISQPLFQAIDSLYPNAALYILAGDAIERPMDVHWNRWYAIMDHIVKKTPIIAAAGNHEYLKGLPPQLEERFFLTFPIYDKVNSGGNACAYVRMGCADFFILDSNKEFWTYPAQRCWLKKRMKQSDAKWKIVMLHHPIYSVRGRFNNILQRMAFNDVIKEYGASLVLQGHEHAYMRKITTDDAQNHTIPVYITSNSSPKNYHIKFTRHGQRHGENDRYYQVINVADDSLSIETYNSAHMLYDKIQITDSCGVKKVEEITLQ